MIFGASVLYAAARDGDVAGLVGLLAVLGCRDEDLSLLDSGSETHLRERRGMLEIESWTDRSGADGELVVSIPVDPGTTSFQLAAYTEEAWPVVDRLIDPSGAVVLEAEEWVGQPRSLLDAFERGRRAIALDWPTRAEDGPLEPGTWTAVLSTVEDPREPVPRVPVELTVFRKDDPDPRRGKLTVHIVYADGLAADPAAVVAVESGVEYCRNILADAGITLDERYHSSDLDPDLAFAAHTPDPRVRDVAEAVTAPGELLMVIGDRFGFDPELRGRASATPGALAATEYLWVAPALTPCAGPPDQRDQLDYDMLGRTMAHELGHYLGLRHVVDRGHASWDAIGDTPECEGEQACEAALGRNLMFPYPLCRRGVCDAAATHLTPGQKAVLQRYVGVL